MSHTQVNTMSASSSSSSSTLAREQAIFDELDLPMQAESTADVPGIFDGEWKKGEASHTLKSYDPSTGRLMATVQGVSVEGQV